MANGDKLQNYTLRTTIQCFTDLEALDIAGKMAQAVDDYVYVSRGNDTPNICCISPKLELLTAKPKGS